MNRAIQILFLLCIVLLSACTGNKYLEENERYFSGYEIKYNTTETKIPQALKFDVEDNISPEPNTKIFGSRPKVWFYHIAGEVEKEKGLKYFIKYKLGEKPVLLSDVNISRNEDIIQGLMYNYGFFEAELSSGIDSSKHSANVNYEVEAGVPYRLDTIVRVTDSLTTEVMNYVRHVEDETLLKPEDLYNTQKLEDERSRISNYLKTMGFFYFRPEHIIFKADSTVGDHKVEVHMQIKEDIPAAAMKIYIINDVNVHLDYDPTDTASTANLDTLTIDHTDYIRKTKLFKPEKINRYVRVDSGEFYSVDKHNVTVRQLSQLGVFRFVNLRYDPDTTTENFLNAEILLSPLPKKSLTAELNVTTNSNNFTGPGLQVEFTNRNAFRGAELLTISGNANYEKQLTGSNLGLTSYEFRLGTKLLIPRYSGPVNLNEKPAIYVPRTKYELEYRIYSQARFYAQSTFSARYGYYWNETETKTHDFTVIGVDYLKMLSISDTLQSLLNDNLLLQESFQDQIIIGPSYTFTLSDQMKQDQLINTYFSANAQFSGNTLTGANELLGSESNAEGDYTLFGVTYAQFTRVQGDVRFYYKTSRDNRLVFRQIAGIGLPYGNSNSLPFAKQFFVGGASSLRGFQPRGLGPGTYEPNEDSGFNGFFDQTGDIVLESNLEYRYSITNVFKTALFIDAGNVWTIDKSVERANGEFQDEAMGQFEGKDFLNEYGVSVGTGLRIDASFLILRFDLAIPVRKPYNPKGERWTFDNISLGSSEWRKDNLFLNIAIGYPF